MAQAAPVGFRTRDAVRENAQDLMRAVTAAA
jgi:hypothetical protein